MCPNTELFLVRIFLHSVFSPNAGKYGPEKLPYLDTFHAVNVITVTHDSRLLFAFKIIISISFILIRKSHNNFLSSNLEDVLEDEKLCFLEDLKL